MDFEKFKLNRDSIMQLLQNFDWDQTKEKVNRESRARILLLGLPNAGKSTLLNRLCGWEVSPPRQSTAARPDFEQTEDFGLFCLADLPETGQSSPYGALDFTPLTGLNNGAGRPVEFGPRYDLGPDAFSLGALEPLALAESADLLIYVLDGVAGVQAADYRWVARLRRLGLPLLVVLNKIDLLSDEIALAVRKAEIEERLATSVQPVSALTGAGVEAELLPRLAGLCPRLTVALGRELSGFRRQAAHRLIGRTAWINGLVALEPVPLIDLPVQIMTLSGLLVRLGAVYDRPPTDVRRREIALAVAGSLAGRFAAQQLVKLIPTVGWLFSGAIGWSATWLLGRTAISYFEAGGDAALERHWRRARSSLYHACGSVYGRWQSRPRLTVQWQRPTPPPLARPAAPAAESVAETVEETTDKE